MNAVSSFELPRCSPAGGPGRSPGTVCLPGGRGCPGSSDQRGTHSSRAGMAPGFGCSFVTFSGCSFSFPARSAQRWRRRWQLHGSAVPVAAVRPREDAGEAQQLPQPGCSLALTPLSGRSPGVSWQRLTPHTALTTDPSTARGQETAEFFLGLLLSLWLPGEHEGVPWLSPPAPSLCNQRGRGATSAAPCVCPALSPPEAPAQLWGHSWRWEGRGGPAPPGCAAGKAVLSQQGLQSWSDRAGGGSGPLVVLVGWWLGATKAVRAALPGQSSSSSQDRTCSILREL